MADFVNRRLVDDNDTGRAGTLQAAIDQSGINAVDEPPVPGSTVGEGTPGGTWGLTQADLLSALGPVLTARSDTFLIKAYGDAVGISGRVVSRAGCEAVVQRTPEPVDRGTNPTANSNLGRKFRIISFRWTGPASWQAVARILEEPCGAGLTKLVLKSNASAYTHRVIFALDIFLPMMILSFPSTIALAFALLPIAQHHSCCQHHLYQHRLLS